MNSMNKQGNNAVYFLSAMKRGLCIGIFVYLLIVIGTLGSAHAQVTPDISLDTIPLNPQPGDTVTVTATSYGADLSQATLSWVYNGKSAGAGIGKTSISVVAPAAGSTATVTVTVNGGVASGVSASIVLRPGSVDLLWEAADAYTPPFYKGKALLPVGGLVRVTAISSATAPNNLSFDWSRNDSALPDVSGYGKSSIIFQESALNTQEKIDVTAHNGVFSGSDTITLAPHDTELLAYKNNEGFIDYANGYDSAIPITTPGVVLHFEPYYFSIPDTIQHDLSIAMTIDGTGVSPQLQNEIGLSRPSSGGQSTVDLAVTTVAYSLQHIEKAFTLLFN